MPGTVRPPPSVSGIDEPSKPLPAAGTPAVAPGPDHQVAHAITSYANTPQMSASNPAMAKVCPTCGVHYPAEFKVCPKDGTELAESVTDSDRDELVGKTLSQSYTILRVIGEGGMGRVYEARHTRISSKRFAVKILHPEFARQPDVISRFQREAEASASIRSANVVDVYDVDRTTDGRPFIVGEFLEGKEFADYLDTTGKMPVGPAVRVVRQICKALIAAHQKGVVHRDMKPENVFLTGDMSKPVAKVIDFGISKVGDAPGTALTKTGMIMGTPQYMAPEQAKGDRVDHRVDVYAVGAILYCALTGQRPFDRDDPTAILTALLTQEPPGPRTIEPTIPQSLELVIQRAMAKSPGDRYQSMAELDAELAPYDPGEGTLALGISDEPSFTGQRRSSLDLRGSSVSMARPLIVLLGSLGLFWAVGIVLTLVTGIVRLVRGPSANLTSFEAVLLIVGLLFAVLTPAILAVRHVAKNVWANTLKAVELSERIFRPVVVALCAYGFGSLLVRVIESVVLRHAAAVAWPMWDVLLFVIGATASIAALVLYQKERQGR